MPESPRWLLKMGREEEARSILARLRSEDGNIENARVTAEFEEIQVAVQLEKEHAAGNTYFAMFFGRHDSLPGLSFNVKTACIPNEGILSIFLCSCKGSPSSLYACLNR